MRLDRPSSVPEREIETEKGSAQGVYVRSNCCCKDLPDDRQEKRRVKCRQAKNICTTMEATAAEKSKGNVLKTSEKMEKVGLSRLHKYPKQANIKYYYDF